MAGCLAMAAACDKPKPATRPVPTPGPQIVVKGSTAADDTKLSRGERIRFAVVGTGSGTHFGASTFLDAPAFSDLRVVAVESSRMLWAEGTVSIAAPAGHKDLAAVTGSELAVDPWAFAIPENDRILSLGSPPASTDTVAALPADAGVIDPPGDVDLFQVVPADSGARTLVFRLRRASEATADFHPTLEIYGPTGLRLAAPSSRCAVIPVHSRNPLFARVADPLHRGGADRRYVLAVHVGLPQDCALPVP